ncbi:MAG: DUF4886 domain-containing protein [Paludibacter sp.]
MNTCKLKSGIILFFIVFCGCLTPVFGQNVIKILAIGNSFSEDAAESYVDDLAKADGVQLIIANMYIGGCSLETHWNNAATNSAAYSYRKIVNGVKTTLSNKTLQEAITDESWDYITFQQVSQYSGKYATYFPYLPNLLNYVKGLATNPNVKYCMHRTWAYATNSTHSEYDYYKKDQAIMYDSIVAVTNKAAEKVGISIIIPAGTAIQNGRTSYVGDNFCRDGYHLSLGLGRFTAACAWYEKLLGKSVFNNTFIPSGVSATEANIARNAAHYAIVTPDNVTSMKDFTAETPTTSDKNIYINFGNATTTAYWNNFTSTASGQSIANLVNNEGSNSGISMTINDAFGGVNTAGPAATTTSFNFPATVTQNSFWGNAGTVFQGVTEPTAGLSLSGMDVNKSYDFNFFSGRTSATDNRETTFTVVGSNEGSSSVDAANNTANLATVREIKPLADGTVTVRIGAGPNNTNANKFFYLNALVISPAVVSGIKQLSLENKLKLYPNPVKDIANLESNVELKKIEITDITGKKVLVDDRNTGNTSRRIDLSSLKRGFYLLNCENGCIRFAKM